MSEETLWPTNAFTISCSVIDGLLLIITTCGYCALSKGVYVSSQYKQNNSHSPRNTDESNSEIDIKKARYGAPIEKFILYGSLISYTLFLLSNILTFTFSINSQHYISGTSSIINSSQVITGGIAKLLMYCVFTHRLYITFNGGNILSYPKWVYYTFYSLLIIGLFLIILLIILDFTGFFHQFILLIVFLYAMDALLSCIMLYLFVNRLQKVIIQRKLYQNSVKDLTKKIKFHAPDKQLLNTITKLTVLSVLCTVTVIVLLILFSIRAYFEGPMNKNQSKYKIYYLYFMVYICNIFFMLMNTICSLGLYLILSFATIHYEKYCQFPHKIVSYCCIRGHKQLIQKKRIKRHSELASVASATELDKTNSVV